MAALSAQCAHWALSLRASFACKHAPGMFAEAAKVLKGKAYATSSVAFSGAMWASRPTARIDGGEKEFPHRAGTGKKKKLPLERGAFAAKP